MTTWLPPKGLQLSREGPPGFLGRKILSVTEWNGSSGPFHTRFEATLPSERLSLGVWLVPDGSYVDRAGGWALERYTIRDGVQTAHAEIFSGRPTSQGFYEPSSSTGVYLGILDGQLGERSAIVAAWEPNVAIERDELRGLFADCHLRATTQRNPDVANEWHSWRAPNNPGVTSGTSQDFVHFFGTAIGFSRPITGTKVFSDDTLYAIPQVFPRRVRITKLFARQDSAGAGAGSWRMGLYSNSSGQLMYPASLLHDSGNVANANQIQTSSPNLLVEADSLVWAVFVGSALAANTISMQAIGEDGMFPLFGCRYDSGSNTYLNSVRIHMGWTHAFTYAALPAIFPSSAPNIAVIQNNGGASGAIAPAIGFAFTYV